MAKVSAWPIKHLCKGGGAVALAVFASLLAAYVHQKLGGWFTLAGFLLVVVASIPMVLFFNLFPSPEKSKRQSKPHVDLSHDRDLFEHDLFEERSDKYLFEDMFDDSIGKFDDHTP